MKLVKCRATTSATRDSCTHTGAKVDLLIVDGTRRHGFEVKRSESPRLTRSMRSAMDTLKLDQLDVVHAGTTSYQLAPGVRAVPLAELADVLRPVRASVE